MASFKWPPLGGGSTGAAIWGDITGTLSNQTDLQTALNLLAPKASPTFTGTATFGSYTAINADGSIGLTASDTSSGHQSTVMGYGASATGFRDVAIGFGAVATGNYGIAIGDGSSAGPYSIGIMGNASTASQGIALGYQAAVGATSAAALGYATFASATGSSAIGAGAHTAYVHSTVVGSDSSASGNLNDTNAQGGLTLGGYNPTGGVTTGENWLAIKYGAAANVPRLLFPAATATDDGTSTLQIYNPGITAGPEGKSYAAININNGLLLINADGSIGTNAQNNNGSNVPDSSNVVIGYDALSSGIGVTAIGAGSSAYANYSTAVGKDASANAPYASTFGYAAFSTSANSTLIGSNSYADTLLSDANAPGGVTLGGSGPSQGENWLGIKPGATTNTPRLLFPIGNPALVDDTVSAVQFYGQVALQGATTSTGSSVGTFTNAPASGNPTGYLTLIINGTPAKIPFW